MIPKEKRDQIIEDTYNMIQQENRCLCVCYTGAGKTSYIIPNLISKLKGEILIVVPTIELLNDSKVRYKDNINVSITTYHSLYKELEINNHIDYIICDEAHHIGVNKWKYIRTITGTN